jgi:hypothetical protein
METEKLSESSSELVEQPPTVEATEPIIEETQSSIDYFKLDEADLRTGLALTQEIARAQARLQACVDAERIFANEMHRKYNLNEQDFTLQDWMTGFEKVKRADGNQTD